MPNTFLSSSVSDLLAAFASREPTPGGGSASALAGAVGASLLVMVASLPKTRNGSDADRAALASAIDALRPAAAELAALIDRDADAYDRVVSAFRLPKSTDAEKAARRDAIQQETLGAIDTPMAMLSAAHVAARAAVVVARHGNASAASDVKVAAALLDAAAAGAYENVAINLSGLTDKASAEALGGEAKRLWEAIGADTAVARAALGG
jgi:glutamate formiminotransferase/formiminotetrahydrofolate cyclodeaminase